MSIMLLSAVFKERHRETAHWSWQQSARLAGHTGAIKGLGSVLCVVVACPASLGHCQATPHKRQRSADARILKPEVLARKAPLEVCKHAAESLQLRQGRRGSAATLGTGAHHRFQPLSGPGTRALRGHALGRRPRLAAARRLQAHGDLCALVHGRLELPDTRVHFVAAGTQLARGAGCWGRIRRLGGPRSPWQRLRHGRLFPQRVHWGRERCIASSKLRIVAALPLRLRLPW
mmetsp:Transcript_87021/g.246743  ORF Transcript_87021/g.246743 Transcript_87021/m.246743 type:complete len:232 (+) Transcript_87021:95-790(+)